LHAGYGPDRADDRHRGALVHVAQGSRDQLEHAVHEQEEAHDNRERGERRALIVALYTTRQLKLAPQTGTHAGVAADRSSVHEVSSRNRWVPTSGRRFPSRCGRSRG
jgi:hypothetical protein